MKLTEMSFEILDNNNLQNYNEIESRKHIEKCGRVCWKSEGKITDDSYISFYNNVVEKKKHKSITEHSCFTKLIDKSLMSDIHNFMLMNTEFNLFRHFKVSINNENTFYYVTANIRAWEEFYNKISNSLKNRIYNIPNYNIELCDNKEIYLKHRLVTVKFIIDLGVSMEFLRHRSINELESNVDIDFSFSQESSRYNLYSSEKHGSECNFIDIDGSKSFFKLKNVTDYNKGLNILKDYMYNVENTYNTLSSLGFPAEWIRAVLPKIAKTELVMTAYCEDWEKFFDLRTENSAHPMARDISLQLLEVFKNRGFYENKEKNE